MAGLRQSWIIAQQLLPGRAVLRAAAARIYGELRTRAQRLDEHGRRELARGRHEINRVYTTGRAYAGRAGAFLDRSFRRTYPAIRLDCGLILVFGATAAISGYLVINDYVIEPLRHEADRAAAEVAAALTEAIDRHVVIAEETAALFSAPDARVDRWTFFEFSKPLTAEIAGLSAIEWLPRVTAAQRSAYEKRAVTDGLLDFHFLEFATDGRRVRAAQRPDYFPVFYVEPYAGNETMLGIDFAANTRGAALLADVRDTGKTAAVTASASPGEPIAPGVSPGISIVVPVYRSRIVPTSVAERQDALSGFVRTNFRFDRLLESLHSRAATLPELKLYIFERDSADSLSLIHTDFSQIDRTSGRPASAQDVFESAPPVVDHIVAGQRWTIAVKPVPGFFQPVLGAAAWGFAGFTLLVTWLLMTHLTTMRLARERAEAANRVKSDFLSMVGHELRTPLNAVIGFSDMMVNELFGPLSNNHYKQYTAHIHRSATHLLELINNIMELSKVEDGFYELDKKDFELAEIWQSVHAIVEPAIDSSQVALEESLSQSALTLNADPVVFRHILLNLVSNAIKFTGAGGRVDVSAALDAEQRLILRVSDTGIGIAREDLELVFTPFQQIDTSLSRKYEGIGVGLPLTRRLVELHGGELLIESVLNQGTDVIVIFSGDIVVARASADSERKPDPVAGAPQSTGPLAPEKAVISRG